MTGAKSDGRQARWDQHNQDRRQHILDAAVEVIEDAAPGADVHVQSIADRAGLGRTVVYRHFTDRDDLDLGVQAHIIGDLREQLRPSLTFSGTPMEIVNRIVGTYVGWAVAHPSLHEFAQRSGSGGRPGPLEEVIEEVAGQIEGLITFGLEVLHADLVEDDALSIDPLVFGLVGAVFTATRRWLSRPERRPGLEPFVALITDSVWLQIVGMAAARGLVIDPDVPVENLLDGSAELSGTSSGVTIAEVVAESAGDNEAETTAEIDVETTR